MHFISDLLNGQGSVLKQYFYFHYYDLIDQLLGRLMRRPAHDGGKITGRDTEPCPHRKKPHALRYNSHELGKQSDETGSICRLEVVGHWLLTLRWILS